MTPETEHERTTRALYAEADDLIREARSRLVPAVAELQRLASADPRAYTPTDRRYVALALLTVAALVRAGRLTDAAIYPECCVHERASHGPG
jgi:hypothetical protein